MWKNIITVKELVEENKQLEEGMKEILQAIKDMQKDPDVKGGETSLIIPSLERLVNVSYVWWWCMSAASPFLGISASDAVIKYLDKKHLKK